MSKAAQPTGAFGPDVLLPLVYQELRRLAAKKLAYEKPGFTLDATGLVHEAYLRLSGRDEQLVWHNERHFFAAAAEAMRRILIDKARSERRLKRGGGQIRLAFGIVEPASDGPSIDVLAIDEALSQFAVEHPEKLALVKLRYFVGLTIPEAAKALGISTATADRHWSYARAWLGRHLRRGGESVQERN